MGNYRDELARVEKTVKYALIIVKGKPKFPLFYYSTILREALIYHIDYLRHCAAAVLAASDKLAAVIED